MILAVTEIINLLYGVGAVLLLVFARRQISISRAQPFYLAFGVMMAAYVFTVLEGLLMPDLFNLMEHGAHALAGFFFVAGLLEWGIGGEDLS